MGNLFHDLELWNEDFTEIRAVLENPKWSMVKYEFRHQGWYIEVDRVCKTPIPYTFNYWDLPQTWNVDDNDPLDVIILSKESFAVWCVVPCRVIWGLKMIDSWEYDYKVVAVADDKYYSHINDISEVHEKEKEDIYYFMLHYKDLQNKTVVLEWWDSKENAIKVLKKSHEEYKVKFGK